MRTAFPALNILSTVLLLCLFKTYGGLVSWWFYMLKSNPEISSRKSGFHARADWIYYLVVVMLIVNIVSAAVMLRETPDRRASVFALAFAAFALLICLLINF
jgi:hypothetical protein